MGNPNKLLAYFGSDLALRNSSRYLSRAHAAGYTLLALDSPAMALATRAGVPYTLLDDWLDPEIIVEAIKVARESGYKWFEPARHEFTVDGICLPQVDIYAMDRFWQDAILALKLASNLKSAGIAKFKFFGNPFPRAGVWHSASDACSKIWQAKLGRAASLSTILEPFDPSGIFYTLQKVLGKLKLGAAAGQKTENFDQTFSKGSVVIVLRYDEDVRFSHLVRELQEHFPGKVAAVIGSHISEKSENVFSKWGVPVSFSARWPLTSWVAALPSQLLPPVDPGLQERFIAGYEKALDASAGQPWHEPMKILGFHFRYYCRYRWPALYRNNFEFWQQLWERTKPRAVLVTGVTESIFLLASEAAERSGIPTFVIPHACGAGRLLLNNLFKSTMLINSRLQERHLERSGMNPMILNGCARLAAKDEYSVVPVKAFSGDSKCRLLALTESVGEGPHLNSYTSPSAQLTVLRSVTDPPPDLKEKVDVKVKVHPYISDLEMIEAAGPQVAERLMPPASELESALKETDLVIAVNYRGGAMVHALKMAKPIIYFLAEKEAMLKREDFPYDTFQDGTVLARTPEEFWGLVRRFMSDPDFGAEMRSKAATFARDNLNDDAYPGLAEFILNSGRSDDNA